MVSLYDQPSSGGRKKKEKKKKKKKWKKKKGSGIQLSCDDLLMRHAKWYFARVDTSNATWLNLRPVRACLLRHTNSQRDRSISFLDAATERSSFSH